MLSRLFFRIPVPYWILMGLTLLGVWWLFGDVLFHPNDYLLSAAGDGQKAYYASEYYLRHVLSGAHHPGFQYPHGNHLLYMDANPLLIGFLSFIQPLWDLSSWIPGIIHISIILSFFPCAALLYYMFRKCLLPESYAMLSALVLTFLSPQIMRLSGHYSLAYVCYVPLLWVLLFTFFERKNRYKWLILYTLAVSIFSFIHPYYFLIGFLFIIVSLIIRGIQYPAFFRENIKLYGVALLLSLLPVMLLKVWEFLTYSGATDAVIYPYGFLNYIAGFETIFLPPRNTAVWEVWNSLIRVRRIGTEGYAYVGITGLLVLLFTLIRIGKLLFRRQGSRIIRPVLAAPLVSFPWVAAVLLVPAMAYPFQLFPELADWLSFVRQFRSLGRIAWVFYYLYMAYAAYFLYATYRSLRIHYHASWKKYIGSGLVIGAMIIWGLEASVLVHSQKQAFLSNLRISYPEQTTDFNQLFREKNIDPQQYQAIIALPFYHHGSEKLFLHNWISSRMSMAVSVDTGLPICNNISARVPLSYMRNAIQLVSHPAIHKELPEKLPDQRPLLLLHQDSLSTRPGEQLLIQRSSPLAQWEGIHFASLPLSAFDDRQKEIKAKFKVQRDRMYQTGQHFLSDSTGFLHVSGFGDEFFRLGEKVLEIEDKKTRFTLYETDRTGLDAGTKIEASFWVQLDPNTNYLPALDIKQYEGEKLMDKTRIPMLESHDIYQDWVRVSAPFVLLDPEYRIVMEIEGRGLRFDNLLIRPDHISVFSVSREREGIIFNNYFIP